MSIRKEKINNEVDITISLLDNAERKDVRSDFYKKVHYRLHKRSERTVPVREKIGWILKPAALTTILFLNIYTVVYFSNETTDDGHDEMLSSFAMEYQLDYSSTEITIADEEE